MTETKKPTRLLVNITDVEELTRLSRATIRRRINAGTFPPPRKRGGCLLWLFKDIEAWAEKRES